MSVGAFIFSRIASKRLPGKALIDINGRPLLGRVIDRSKMIKGVDRIVVATTTNREDDDIVDFAINEGVEVYRGSSHDVASRALGCCDFFKTNKFVRICGDRPFFDPSLISLLIKIHNNLGMDIVTTTFPRTYPPGLTGEVVSTQALRNSIQKMTADDKEHVTSYFYKNSSDFLIKNIDSNYNIEFPGLNLCVDSKIDLDRAEWMATHLDKVANGNYHISETLLFAKAWYKANKIIK